MGNYVKGIVCRGRHGAVGTDDGEIFSWGWSKYGQLGLGDVFYRSTPTPVVTKNYIPKKIAGGWWHTLVV